jgi:hypothetical protein
MFGYCSKDGTQVPLPVQESIHWKTLSSSSQKPENREVKQAEAPAEETRTRKCSKTQDATAITAQVENAIKSIMIKYDEIDVKFQH